MRSNKYFALLNPCMCHTWKNIKISYKNNKFTSVQRRMINLTYLKDRILYQILIRKHGKKADNAPIRIYVSKIEKRTHLEKRKGITSNF